MRRYIFCSHKGVSLVEVLIGLLIVILASIASLIYFAYARGGVGKEGNRRAALERARERLEQMMEAPSSAMKPPVDGALPPNNQPLFWVDCTGGSCGWANADPGEIVDVDDLAGQRLEATVQWKDDPAAGTAGTPDVLELGVKVWFIPGAGVPDTNFHRVHVRTLRTPI
jgi:hypothetical protein